ncbi:HNH endonuclease [Mycolicibacterium pulveris]|nr:HNH endonuclease [Mycolicibacterium pulveris]
MIPPALLAELIANGATVRSVYRPDDIADPGYRPPQPCQRFIRMRDLTCRFPGCDRPAQHCDIDHTIPHPAGRTHPSNTKCLCRLHHLLKTFCGWHDQQLPDGTITWTAPSGHTYTTHPLSRMLFPHWNTTTDSAAGTTNNYPTAPSPGQPPADTPTPPTRSAACCSHTGTPPPPTYPHPHTHPHHLQPNAT